MPLPKRRHSRQRGRKRRTHWKLTPPTLVDCPHCHEPKMPHRVCPHCGYYAGKPVLTIEEKK
ncbi:MAG: 50S ribosomal protein L32 [candidate division WOR-3 bacterium]|jgi:large subunit ribosomal protein L32|uniref:Large ribosomal subunit protein bL32 n=1 Tax=candidate division WOR-3 bacterium TaxID=2052148 RepID=A0A7C1NES7_UNCW3|nr:50S ribosomal protein L32 [candidate division WOR-3 bacterium]